MVIMMFRGTTNNILCLQALSVLKLGIIVSRIIMLWLLLVRLDLLLLRDSWLELFSILKIVHSSSIKIVLNLYCLCLYLEPVVFHLVYMKWCNSRWLCQI